MQIPVHATSGKSALELENSANNDVFSFVTLWRIEDPQGKGPFTSCNSPYIEELMRIDQVTFYDSFPSWTEELWHDVDDNYVGRGLHGIYKLLAQIMEVPEVPRYIASDNTSVRDNLLAGALELGELVSWLNRMPALKSALADAGYHFGLYKALHEGVLVGHRDNGKQVVFCNGLAEKVCAFSLNDF